MSEGVNSQQVQILIQLLSIKVSPRYQSVDERVVSGVF